MWYIKWFFLLILVFIYPFNLSADAKKFECRYYIENLKRYYTNKITIDTWAMSGKIENTTASLKDKLKNKIEYGSLHNDNENFMITIDDGKLGFTHHLIRNDLMYLKEHNVFNILGKNPEDRKKIINRIYQKGDCRILK